MAAIPVVTVRPRVERIETAVEDRQPGVEVIETPGEAGWPTPAAAQISPDEAPSHTFRVEVVGPAEGG